MMVHQKIQVLFLPAALCSVVGVKEIMRCKAAECILCYSGVACSIQMSLKKFLRNRKRKSYF